MTNKRLRHQRTRTAVAVVVIGLSATVAVIAISAPHPESSPSWGHVHGDVSEFAAPTEKGGVLIPPDAATPLPGEDTPPGTTGETSLSAAASSPIGAAAGAASARASAAPAAGSPTGRSLGSPRPDVSPNDVLGVSDNLGGCLTDYGSTGQCLPTIPPSQADHVQAMVDAGIDPSSMRHEWNCTEVRGYFPHGLDVRGDDTESLDRNRDGTACGPGD